MRSLQASPRPAFQECLLLPAGLCFSARCETGLIAHCTLVSSQRRAGMVILAQARRVTIRWQFGRPGG